MGRRRNVDVPSRMDAQAGLELLRRALILRRGMSRQFGAELGWVSAGSKAPSTMAVKIPTRRACAG